MITRITGTLAIRERIALPDNAYAMVEVRNSAGPDAMPVVAEETIALEGRQPPVPFAITVDRMRLPMDIGFAFSGAFFVDGKVRYASAQIPVNLALHDVDLGMVMLQAHQIEAFASELACGDRLVRISAAQDAMQINLDGTVHRLTETPAASGVKYVSTGDPAITFWNKGDEFSLAIGNEPAQQCRILDGGPDLADLLTSPFTARGQEPSWLLRIADGRLSWQEGAGAASRSFHLAPPEIDGRRAVVTAVNGPRVTIEARPCQDTMSGTFYPTAVRVERGGTVLRGCGGEPADVLTANEWVVEDLDGGGIIDRSNATLTFGRDGRVAGSASCNRYSGSYAATGEGLTFGNAAVTRMACAPALMEQEEKFLAIIQDARSFTISNTGALVIQTSDGRSMTARPAR